MHKRRGRLCPTVNLSCKADEAHMWTDQPAIEPKRMLNLTVGLASPLWPTFIAAASTGLAYWWLSSLAKSKAVADEALAPVPALLAAPQAVVEAEPAVAAVAVEAAAKPAPKPRKPRAPKTA
jgi:hypothetical protein